MDQNSDGKGYKNGFLLWFWASLVVFFDTVEREKLKIITQELIDEVEGGMVDWGETKKLNWILCFRFIESSSHRPEK